MKAKLVLSSLLAGMVTWSSMAAGTVNYTNKVSNLVVETNLYLSAATSPGVLAVSTPGGVVGVTDSPQVKMLQLPNGMTITTNGAFVLNGDGPLFAGSAKAQPYRDLTGATFCMGSGAEGAIFEFIAHSYDYRLRQDGAVRAIQLKFRTNALPSSLTVRFWRPNGANFDLVGETEDLSTRLTNNTTCFITLTNSVQGLLAGDYYGARATNGASTMMFQCIVSAAPSFSYYITSGSPTESNYDWDSQTGIAYMVPLEVYMDRPDAVFIGDSITQGVPNNYAFTQTNYAAFNRATYWGNIVATTMGWTYQNMGHGSDHTWEMLQRFTNDVLTIKPKYVILEGGINDVLHNTNSALTIANWTNMVQQAIAAGIKPIVIPILPCTGAVTSEKMQARDTVNAAITNLAGVIVVTGVDQAIGVYRPSGDVGNLWDINPLYAADAYHLNAAGSRVLADLVNASIISRTTSAILSVDQRGMLRPNGLELVSPDGNVWRATIGDDGVLTWTK